VYMVAARGCGAGVTLAVVLLFVSAVSLWAVVAILDRTR
jgi:hypothetical protein